MCRRWIPLDKLALSRFDSVVQTPQSEFPACERSCSDTNAHTCHSLICRVSRKCDDYFVTTIFRSLRVRIPIIHIEATISSHIGILHPRVPRNLGGHHSTLELSNIQLRATPPAG